MSDEVNKPENDGRHFTLGTLLGIAKGMTPTPVAIEYIVYAKRVNNLGNEGAHRIVEFIPSDVASGIHDAVVVLNQVYSTKPESQS
jgi:hypothetical protein